VKLDRNSVPSLAAKVRLQFDRHSGQHLLLYPERGMQLDDSAAAIIKRCDGLHSIAEIAGSLAIEFDADAFDVESDALGFLQALSDRALLVLA
jgi:pyrroloquinoline quinone biosynthesis protein D